VTSESDSSGQGGAYDLDGAGVDRAKILRAAKRIVVKVGTRILSRDDSSLDEDYIDGLMEQVAGVRASGVEVAIVSSGAVGAGMGSLGLRYRPKQIDVLQGLAGIGQTVLMHRYKTAARAREMRVGQVLVTAGDLNRKRDYMHVRSALQALFRLDAIPIVNENDSVAVDELRFGDNDSLSAHVANLVDADALLILTDADGLHEGAPDADSQTPIVRTVHRVDRSVEQLCGSGGSGIGGMLTKLDAAKTLAASGVATVIAHGRKATVADILAGKPVGTLIVPQPGVARGHRRWILARKVSGTLVIDQGAVRALVSKRTSLLPSGISAVEGRFARGAAVSVVGPDRHEVARGLIAYSSSDARKLAGRQTSEIAEIVGHYAGDEMMHRDNLVMVANGTT